MLPAARKLNAADPVATIEAPKEVEEVPRALTSSEFSALADLERDELTFDFEALGSDDAIDAEIVDEQTG